jgi:cytoskeletal protein CcmA (bactofilin family)
MRGQLICTDTVFVKLQGKLQGSIESEKLVVDKKAEAEFTKPLRARSVEINGKATGEVLCDGRVTINKNGDLSGVVYARSIVVEKGGIFSGELHIGEDLEKSSEASAEPSPQAEEPAPAPPSAESAPAAPPESLPMIPVSPPKTGLLPGFEPKKPPETPGRTQRPGSPGKGKPTRKIR